MTPRPPPRPAPPPSCSAGGAGGDYDPAGVGIRDAATVLILDERPDLHVLMLQRNSASVFAGDMWVFPGGAVDVADASPEADATVAGLTDAEASRRLGLDAGGIAFWVAALRETFEEAGILLAHRAGRAAGPDAAGRAAGPDDGIIDLSPPAVSERFSRYRAEVNAGTRDFVATVSGENLRLDGNDVHFVARWITPLGPPRRYDTRFFVTAMPPGQRPLHDNDEAVSNRWVRAADARALSAGGELVMMTPTVGMLTRLATFGSVAEATAAAAAGTPADDEVVRIRFGNDGPDRIAFPSHPDYDDADDRSETGMLRWPAGSAAERV
ncbi:MAG TPA: hypothetical protein DEP69_04160 [Acidimicrobiaceae bacterium]|nr:hypothetical protein [Acidimicrobiaceae bacterium]